MLASWSVFADHIEGAKRSCDQIGEKFMKYPEKPYRADTLMKEAAN
jgi:hypothetical protein